MSEKTNAKTTKNAKISTVNCPTCHSPVEWLEKNELRPFCSDRCKLIDLGAWASEEYKVPGKPVSEWDLDEGTMGNGNPTIQ
jgi:endogenous inhibitor of DNA gyrase (YacG/DUF329 family)